MKSKLQRSMYSRVIDLAPSVKLLGGGRTFKGRNLVGILQVTQGVDFKGLEKYIPSLFLSLFHLLAMKSMLCHMTSYPTTGPKAKEATL